MEELCSFIEQSYDYAQNEDSVNSKKVLMQVLTDPAASKFVETILELLYKRL